MAGRADRPQAKAQVALVSANVCGVKRVRVEHAYWRAAEMEAMLCS